ncbi:MAG: UDP-N-acetylmuramoyl-tripeptide--D-alanyl-D-alanine ligase [Clostridia bacterium]|nr:UDP-N-acetylmuramoyl-tripeptide--D-alanyl-D-alanine ligase [Clostridia bacterium]
MLALPNGTALAKACQGTLLYDAGRPVTSVVIDSRLVKDDALFVALAGENTDGHRYLLSAADSGASTVLVEREDIDLAALREKNCSVVLCDSTALALGRLAKAHKASCPALTVGVTGSVGKTTTRQFIHAVLSRRFRTHKTEGNYNNELGLPLTLLALSPNHEAAVLEMGMSQKGEISYLTSLATPDIAVITNIGTAHIEFLGSREAIRDAKMEIAEGLTPEGKLILNGDEPLLAEVEGAVYVALHNPNAPFRAVNLRYTPDGMVFDALYPNGRIDGCRISTLGEHTVLDAMFAVAVGVTAGLTAEEIRAGLADFEGVGMRQKVCRHQSMTFILDYYNAGAESMKASLTVAKRLAASQGGRTVAVLGSILELGEHSESLHRSVGAHTASLSIDLLFTFGAEADAIGKEAIACGMSPKAVLSFPDISDAGAITEALREALLPGDCILMKASHSIRLGRVADALIQENN